MTDLPWLSTRALTDDEWFNTRERAILECLKWDQQVGDVATLARRPILLRPAAWAELGVLAEALARECAQAEEELTTRLELHSELGLPRRVRHALRQGNRLGVSAGVARTIRFDFHYTTEGWRISEGNSDVPGGHNEADGYPALMLPFFAGASPLGSSPVASLTKALQDAHLTADAPVGLVHATSYSDDRQVMLYLERALLQAGLPARLLSPVDLRWNDGAAHAVGQGRALQPLAAVVRFFPGEWLSNLPRACGWRHYFAAGRTPLSNPGTALLTQSKRFPLLWDRLRIPLPTWRKLLPETVTIQHADRAVFDHDEGWVVKPALGRVGEGVGACDLVSTKKWQNIVRAIRRRPQDWVAQRRFQAVPMQTDDGPLYPCIGVYTVDGRTAGAYGRLATKPVVDATALDTAVLLGH